MNGLPEILRFCREAAVRGEPTVLATVVQVAGSTYRRPGARMLFRRDAEPLGLLSGGCLESDLAERASEVLASGEPTTVVYDMRSPDDLVWGIGLGCEGEVRVLLERLAGSRISEELSFIDECLRGRRAGIVATLFEVSGGALPRVGDRLLVDATGRVQGSPGLGALEAALLHDARQLLEERRSAVRRYEIGGGHVAVLLERLVPPLALHLFGAGADARPLVRMAAGLGWQVTVYDHRAEYARPERFPEALRVERIRMEALPDRLVDPDRRSAAILMTHHFLHDLALLERLLPLELGYLGLIGPEKRAAKLLQELEARGFEPTPEQRARMHGPVGLDIGSETPEEIAVSILAEIQAVFSGRSGGFLRDRRAPLHDWRG